jgi:hypothetical protein
MLVVCNLMFAAACASAFLTPAAMAQSRIHRDDDQYEKRYRIPYHEEENYCIPQCPQDLSPCDPLYFKRADGRCSGDNRRK